MAEYKHTVQGGFEYHFRPAKNQPSAQPIVFCHGYAASWDYHNPFSDQLSDHDYYAIVLPGHGDLPHESGQLKVSEYAKHLAAFVEATKLKRVVLMGHSMGGAVAAGAANLLRPGIVDKLIIVSPMNAASAWKGIRFKTTFKPNAKRLDGFLRKFTKCLYFDQRSPYDDPIAGKRLFDADRAFYGRHSAAFRTLNRQMGTLAELRGVTANYRRLRLPVYLILGQKDKILPVKMTIRRLRKDIAGLTHTQLLRTGHLPFRERQVDYHAIVQSILANKTIKQVY